MLYAATQAKMDFNADKITYKELRAIVQEYVDAANIVGKKIAKKYDTRHRKISVTTFIR